MPKVTVCIPIYNAEQYLEQCARSLLEQTLDDMEFLFVDDGSTDNSLAILRRVLNDYPARREQTKILVHSNNKGLVPARKTALKNATGSYIIHCDADDWVDPEMYSTLYRIARNENADMVYCSFMREEQNRCFAVPQRPEFANSEAMINGILRGDVHGALWNRLWRREIVFAQVDDCPDDLTMCEDQRLNLQMLLRAKKICCCPEPFYHYRANETSITANGRIGSIIQSEIKNIQFFETLLPGKRYVKALNSYQQRLLLDGILLDSIPARQWHSLWTAAKWRIWQNPQYGIKLKAAMLCAMFNYSLTQKIWYFLKSRHNKNQYFNNKY